MYPSFPTKKRSPDGLSHCRCLFECLATAFLSLDSRGLESGPRIRSILNAAFRVSSGLFHCTIIVCLIVFTGRSDKTKKKNACRASHRPLLRAAALFAAFRDRWPIWHVSLRVFFLFHFLGSLLASMCTKTSKNRRLYLNVRCVRPSGSISSENKKFITFTNVGMFVCSTGVSFRNSFQPYLFRIFYQIRVWRGRSN